MGMSSNIRHYMKYIFCIGLAVAISLSAMAGDSAGDAKAVEGNWKPIKAELAGQPMAEAVMKSISLKLENGQYEVFVGASPDRGTYTLDSAAKPKGDDDYRDGGGRITGKTFPAIYEVNGDTLRICYDLSGAKRPTEFKSVVGTKLYLVTYIGRRSSWFHKLCSGGL